MFGIEQTSKCKLRETSLCSGGFTIGDCQRLLSLTRLSPALWPGFVNSTDQSLSQINSFLCHVRDLSDLQGNH